MIQITQLLPFFRGCQSDRFAVSQAVEMADTTKGPLTKVPEVKLVETHTASRNSE
jgi:hypothetical protein